MRLLGFVTLLGIFSCQTISTKDNIPDPVPEFAPCIVSVDGGGVFCPDILDTTKFIPFDGLDEYVCLPYSDLQTILMWMKRSRK